MKKFLTLLLILTMVLSLVACGGKGGGDEESGFSSPEDVAANFFEAAAESSRDVTLSFPEEVMDSYLDDWDIRERDFADVVGFRVEEDAIVEVAEKDEDIDVNEIADYYEEEFDLEVTDAQVVGVAITNENEDYVDSYYILTVEIDETWYCDFEDLIFDNLSIYAEEFEAYAAEDFDDFSANDGSYAVERQVEAVAETTANNEDPIY